MPAFICMQTNQPKSHALKFKGADEPNYPAMLCVRVYVSLCGV